MSHGASLQWLRSVCAAAETLVNQDGKYHFGVVGSGPAGFYTANLVRIPQQTIERTGALL